MEEKNTLLASEETVETTNYKSKSLNSKIFIAQQITVAKDYMRSLYCNKKEG